MKITASKRDDIIKRRDEWQKDYDSRKAKRDAEEAQYDDEYYAISDKIIETVQGMLSEFDALNIRVGAAPTFGGHYYAVDIYVNDENKFDDDVALSWTYNIQVSDDGEVKKSSNSWSGLRATTSAQLESLKQSVACIETIMNIDWSFLMNYRRPKYSDYVKTPVPADRSSEFDRELLEADIEDIIGTNQVVEYDGPTRRYSKGWGNVVYIGIISETPKLYKIFEVLESQLGDIDYAEAADYAYNVHKDTVLRGVAKPLNIKEI